eukprot:TRINITY_DN21920_c0_g1_i1.p1 TRINITY_DN21920_c0_g1~~TRINITY_DN21920_c0_g1_i1.p1  ORF type:complete len:348 (+),score=43.89 TRINITY_DN21920_c0_g1_i1:673-1716(+)
MIPEDDSENSLHFNRSYGENYATCFRKRERCTWYSNGSFQDAFVFCAMLCLICVIASVAGCTGLSSPPPQMRAATLEDEMSMASSYGQLLEACDRLGDNDRTVDLWIVRGSWAAMLYGVALIMLAITMLLHVNFGVAFGFGVDGFISVLMCGFQVVVAMSACMVQKHLSTMSRLVVQWWILAFALSKIALAFCDLVLTTMYFNEAIGGFVAQNSSFCNAGYLFCWMLIVSMLCQSVAGLSLSRIFSRTTSHIGGVQETSRIVGGSALLLVLTTFGVGMGLGVCCAMFVFDNPNDAIDPMDGIALSYGVAAICQFLAGASTLRANTQVRTYYQKDARTINGIEMSSDF